VAVKSYPYIDIKQQNKSFILTKLPAKHLTKIAYASVRGDSDEEGAVQRYLSQRRIAGVRAFALEGGDYPSCIVLNWRKGKLVRTSGKVTIPQVFRSAQIIDGQHRVAGLEEAIKEDPKVGRVEIPVAIYNNLTTQECADIFLAINTEQKPVSRSLVYDLYGLASSHLVDQTALRAKDIATALNESEDSPYQGLIKFPGAPRTRGGIALSTVVSALKPLVDEKGPLELAGIRELERQTVVILNLFNALREKYGEKWESTDNPFQYASGFAGAILFFRNKIIDYCKSKKSFTKQTISDAIKLRQNQLLEQSDVKGQSGSAAVNMIYDSLLDVYAPGEADDEEEIEI